MITEDYVSFETAKLLKEKGFDENTLMVYSQNGSFMPNGAIEDTYQIFYSASTLQMAMKWLREIYHLDIAIYPYGDYPCDNYQFDVYRDRALMVSKDDGFISYEQACEAAILYCLENLI